MRLQSCTPAWFATAICMIVGLPFATADDAPGVVRMTDFYSSPIQQTSFLGGGCLHKDDGCGESACCPQEDCCPTDSCCAPTECCPPTECCAPSECCPAPVSCGTDSACCSTGCGEGCDGCCESGCDSGSRGCGCGCSGRHSNTLFGGLFCTKQSRCSCDYCDHCGKGKNHCGNTLLDCLCGKMIPSGMCGQGAPLCGKYQITYADRPAYADPRDGQAWAAQGYGMPITVPTAPVVRFSYNYSHGTPASRLTPLSTYNPTTSPQRLYHQSWH